MDEYVRKAQLGFTGVLMLILVVPHVKRFEVRCRAVHATMLVGFFLFRFFFSKEKKVVVLQ